MDCEFPTVCGVVAWRVRVADTQRAGNGWKPLVSLGRCAGRDPDDLAREFEPTGHSIRAWVAQADRNEGRRAELTPGLATAERDELIRLRRENKQLRLERDILSKAAAWFARETGTLPSGSSGS
jgi:transposase